MCTAAAAQDYDQSGPPIVMPTLCKVMMMLILCFIVTIIMLSDYYMCYY